MDNKEMSLTELDAEMAIALPEREVMWCWRNTTYNHYVQVINIGGQANAMNENSLLSVAAAQANVYFYGGTTFMNN